MHKFLENIIWKDIGKLDFNTNNTEIILEQKVRNVSISEIKIDPAINRSIKAYRESNLKVKRGRGWDDSHDSLTLDLGVKMV